MLARQDARRAIVVLSLLAGVFALRAIVGDPAIGVGFLYVVPTLLAALWFGRLAGLAVGAVGAGLFLIGALFQPQDNLVSATLLRLVVFCSVGYAFAFLSRRTRILSGRLNVQQRELEELRALRSALVPPEVPDRPAVELATCFVPAQERVAGDFFVINEGPEDATVVVVGDVVGKGVEAARLAAFVRATLAAYASYNDDPCQLLELANAALVERIGTSETSSRRRASSTARPTVRSRGPSPDIRRPCCSTRVSDLTGSPRGSRSASPTASSAAAASAGSTPETESCCSPTASRRPAAPLPTSSPRAGHGSGRYRNCSATRELPRCWSSTTARGRARFCGR